MIDGDTLEVRRDDRATGRVRLIGINAPELAHDGKPAQCGAEMARDLLQPLRDQRIRIVHDASQATTDKYDRTLAYTRHDGLDVGVEQIAAGAREYTYGTSFYGQRSEYVQLQNNARDQDRGFWGECLQVPANGRVSGASDHRADAPPTRSYHSSINTTMRPRSIRIVILRKRLTGGPPLCRWTLTLPCIPAIRQGTSVGPSHGTKHH